MSRSDLASSSPPPHPLSRRAALRTLGSVALWCSTTLGLRDARASQPSFKIIVHPSNPLGSAEPRFVADIFLKNVKSFDADVTAQPADQKASSPARRTFSRVILKRSVQAVRNYWQQRIFSGRGVPPPEFETDAEIVAYVLEHRGGIGYVSPEAAIGKARVVVVR
jgi:hypothetical protein